MTLEICTNNQPRALITWAYLTDAERAQHDWEGAQECYFVRYKGWAHCLSDFMRTDNPDLKGWDGISADSFFSGVLVRYVDSETVVLGSYYC